MFSGSSLLDAARALTQTAARVQHWQALRWRDHALNLSQVAAIKPWSGQSGYRGDLPCTHERRVEVLR